MTKKNILLIAGGCLAFAVLSGNVSAVTIDYRHEMKDTAKRDHKDRLLISHRFANGFGLSSEVKWKSGDNKSDSPYDDTISDGSEVVASYLHKFDQTWFAETGFSLESGKDSNNYRPYVTGGVNWNDDVSTTLRYRPYYKRIADGKGEDDRGHQLNLVVNWKFHKDFTFSSDFEWKHSENTVQWDDEKTGWLYEGKLAYSLDKNWKPYVAIANVGGDDKYDDQRQTRYRVGIQYNF